MQGTDELNAVEIDRLLSAQEAATCFRERRRALEKGSRLGLPPIMLREVKRQIINYLTIWRGRRQERDAA
jgi:hypothetical protein